MRLTAPTAVRMPDGKYGRARAKVIHTMPFFSLARSIASSLSALAMTFSAVLRKKKRMSRKLRTTPTVSASQEMRMPNGSPKISPFAVEMKTDGKMLPMLISTSMEKLTSMAQGPKERK